MLQSSMNFRLKVPAAAAAWLLLLTTSAGCADTAPAISHGRAALDQFVTREMAARHIPGLSIAVVQNGRLVMAQGYGTANVELASPATPKTVYCLASLSKQFTAAAILLLAQDGKLSLDSPAAQLLPSLKLPDSWDTITVRELLNQTSGLPNYTALANTDTNTDPFLKDYTPSEIIRLIASRPLAFAPGARFEYSNTNYYLLARIVQTVSGKPLPAFLQQRIFQPLGMTSTGEFDQSAIRPGRAARYLWMGGKLLNDCFDSSPSFREGAGGIESSALDMAKWDSALDTSFPLTAASKRLMWTAPKLSSPPPAYRYGFGWVVDTYNQRPMIWHNGELPGATCWMGRFPESHLTVIVLCNLLDVDSEISAVGRFAQIGEWVAGYYDPMLKPSNWRGTTIRSGHSSTIDPADLAVCRKAFQDIAAGAAEPSMYTDSTAKALFPTAIEQTRAIFQSLGKLEQVEPLGERAEQGSHVVTCRAVFTGGNLTYDVYLEAGTRKIMGILPQR